MEIQEQKIRKIFREELNTFMETLLLRLRFENLPVVTDEEQQEIESLYKDDLLTHDEDDIVHSKKVRL